MIENQDIRPAQVIGPLGEPLTVDDLPSPKTKRWVVRRKAEVVAAVNGGLLTIDEVLERFQRSALEYGAEFSNHGPMAAEALVALGHPALLTGWVDLYAPRLPPFEPGVSLDGEARRSALGVAARAGDWVATWEAELAHREWRVVLREAVRDVRRHFGEARARARPTRLLLFSTLESRRAAAAGRRRRARR